MLIVFLRCLMTLCCLVIFMYEKPSLFLWVDSMCFLCNCTDLFSPHKAFSGMGGLTAGSLSVGRVCQQAGFPLGYVGGEAGRPGTPTTDKARRAFLWGRSPLEGFTLDWCWFSFCFLFPVFCRGLNILPRALLRHFSLRAKAKCCCWQRVPGEGREREKRAHLSPLFPL